METIVDLRRDPSNPMSHESAEGESPSADRCPGFASADGELPGSVPSALTIRQLATNPAFELIRWELEGRIVANQPAEDIAQRMCLPKSVVEQYEADHFHVRPSLAHASVVLFEVIGVSMNDTWAPAEVGKFWKWLGFTYGVSTLDQVIPPFRDLDDKLRSRGLRAYLAPECNVCEQFRVLVAAKLVPAAATLSEAGVSLVARLRSQVQRQVRPSLVVSTDLAALSVMECPVHESRRDSPLRSKEAA